MKLLLCIALFILVVNAEPPPDRPHILCRKSCLPFLPCPDLNCTSNEREIKPNSCSCCNKCLPPITRGNSCLIGNGLKEPCEDGYSCLGDRCEKKPERMCKMDCNAVKCGTCAEGEVEIRETCRCCSRCVKPIAMGDSCQIEGRGNIPCEAGLFCIENKCQETLFCKMDCRLVRCARPICAEGEVLQSEPCSCCGVCVKQIQ